MRNNIIKASGLAALIIAIITLLIISDAFAQRGRGYGRGRSWDAKKVKTIKGEVSSIEKWGRWGYGLKVKTAKETVFVHLGPEWYLKDKGLVIKEKANVEITGYKTTIRGKESLIASQVKADGKTLTLRDKNGYPAWARKGRRGRGNRGGGGCLGNGRGNRGGGGCW